MSEFTYIDSLVDQIRRGEIKISRQLLYDLAKVFNLPETRVLELLSVNSGRVTVEVPIVKEPTPKYRKGDYLLVVDRNFKDFRLSQPILCRIENSSIEFAGSGILEVKYDVRRFFCSEDREMLLEVHGRTYHNITCKLHLERVDRFNVIKTVVNTCEIASYLHRHPYTSIFV
jgi:hypothetical protein